MTGAIATGNIGCDGSCAGATCGMNSMADIASLELRIDPLPLSYFVLLYDLIWHVVTSDDAGLRTDRDRYQSI